MMVEMGELLELKIQLIQINLVHAIRAMMVLLGHEPRIVRLPEYMREYQEMHKMP